jgi:hypothetical protein
MAKFDNPNYNPEAGMKYLATHFEMFKPEVAKAMIADAKRKGVKIPPVVEAKARKAGILNSARNAKFKAGDKVKFKNLFKPERGEETGVVTGYDTNGLVLIRDNDGIKVQASEKLVRLANSVRNAKYVKGVKVVSPKGNVRGEIVGVRSIYQHGFKDEVFDVLLESGPRKGEVMRSQTEGEWLLANSVRSTNAKRVRVLKAERLVPDRLVGQIVEVVGGRGDDVFVKDPKFPHLNIPTLLKKGEYEVVNSVCNANTKWVIHYWDGGKEKIEAPTRDAAKREADKRARKSGRGYKRIIVDDGVDYGPYLFFNSIHNTPSVNSVRSTNAVVAKALAMNGAEEKWGNPKTILIGNPNAKMLKEKNGWQLWEGPHGYEMLRSNGHGGVGWGKVSRAAAIKHFDKFVADPIRTPLTINAVRNAWADAPDAATAKRDIEQTVRKAAEIAKKQSGAKATYKLTPNDNYWCGYIELTFNTEEEAKKYNPYYLFDELGDNKSILPKWSWAISSFNYQKNGKVVKIFVGRLAT